MKLLTGFALWVAAAGLAAQTVRPGAPEAGIASRVREGAALVRGGRTAEGRRLVAEAAALAGEDVRLRTLLAAELEYAGFAGQALQVCEQTAERAGDDSVFHGVYGAVLLALKRWGDAAVHLEIAVTRMPDVADHWWRLGRAKLHMSREAEALSAVERALALRPDDRQALMVRAECEFKNMKLAECEATTLRILAQSPADTGATALLMRARRMSGRIAEAIAAADVFRTATGGRSDPEILLERGIARLAAGEAAAAVDDLTAVARSRPQDPRPWLHLMKAWRKLRDPDQEALARRRYAELSKAAKPSSP